MQVHRRKNTMGTTSIEYVVRKMGIESKDPRTDEAVEAALKELDAIRRAAKTLREEWRCLPVTTEQTFSEAANVFESIAMEEP
jgi:hypothetical protein